MYIYYVALEVFKLAVENFKPKKRLRKPDIKKILIFCAIAIALTFTISVSAVNYSKANDYKSQTADASKQCEQVKESIKHDTDLIDGKGFDQYCEKIAREQYGYAKPGEYVIYDSAFGN